MLTEDQMRNELGSLFRGAVTDHPDVMAECVSMLRSFALDPSTLFYKYEAFVMSRPSGLREKLATLTLSSARELRRELQREQATKAVTANATPGDTPKAGGVGVRKGRNMGDLGGFLDGLTTPSRHSKPKSAKPLVTAMPAANGHSPSTASAFTPTANRSDFATPSKGSPMPPAASSYRPGPSRPALPNTNGYLTPAGKGPSAPSSPVSGGEGSSTLTPRRTQSFSQRPQPHSLVETLNSHLPGTSSGVPVGSKARVGFTTSVDYNEWNYRYMFEKISQRSEALDDMIDEYAESIKDAYGITELGDPHFVSEEAIYTVGRVLSPPTDNAKVNAGSLYLESSRLLGSGKRVALKFKPTNELKVRGGAPGVKGFGVFPGCLLCVKGRNGGGGAFVVEEVLMAPPSAMPQSPASELLEYHYGDKLSGEAVSISIAAGPYTLDDDLSYEPLQALIDVAIRERPDVLILLGPFVDSQHPKIQMGAVTQTPTEIFKDQITARLQRLYEASPGTKVALVPSIRDIVSRHVAYPQAALDRESLGLLKRVQCLPNPCTISINEVTIAINSVDTLFHLRREELFTRAEEAEPTAEPESKDAMANLIRHVLSQRSFYPIFPPPEAQAGEVNLDVTHQALTRMEGAAPDILILPSKLKHFSKIVDSTLVVNPAHLARAHAGGTFAKLIIQPLSREQLEVGGDGMDVDGDAADDFKEHAIWDRARSEIWRI